MDFNAWLRLYHAKNLNPEQKAQRARDCIDSPYCSDLRVDDSVIQSELDWLQRDPKHHLLVLPHPHYPEPLRSLSAAPVLLYVVGDTELLNLPSIAIVGSRNATADGRNTASQWAGDLAQKGLVIASGLAEGVDAAAHRGALDSGGLTVAYMGTGADRVYPASNRSLAHAIAENGALVSCFPIGCHPRKHHFPIRNRLIAINSLATLVVEASLKSGSLITARLASEFGRDVFAIPGSRHSPVSAGCHELIRDGARLVTHTGHVLEEISRLLPQALEQLHPKTSSCVEKNDEIDDPLVVELLDAMAYTPYSIDQLSKITTLNPQQIASSMLMLSLGDRVQSLGNGYYQRLKN